MSGRILAGGKCHRLLPAEASPARRVDNTLLFWRIRYPCEAKHTGGHHGGSDNQNSGQCSGISSWHFAESTNGTRVGGAEGLTDDGHSRRGGSQAQSHRSPAGKRRPCEHVLVNT